MDTRYFNQAQFPVRCEWGERGIAALQSQSDVIIIVDVLSFSTCAAREEACAMAIDQRQLVREVMEILDETFEHHHGIFLDKNTSLFPTLAAITSSQASRPVGTTCASIAAQVAHVTFYLEVLERYLIANDTSKADWGEIWRTVEQVTPSEWEELKANLEQVYRRIVSELQAVTTWESDPHLATALAITVHTAYHLGEIRQALCTIT